MTLYEFIDMYTFPQNLELLIYCQDGVKIAEFSDNHIVDRQLKLTPLKDSNLCDKEVTSLRALGKDLFEVSIR